MDLTIRPAQTEDVPAIVILTGQLGYPVDPSAIAARLNAIARDDHAVLVAVIDGEVAGWIHVCEMPAVQRDVSAEIRGLVVDDARRGAGIGAALVEAAERWARTRGIERLRVRSKMERERAHLFYERLGFRVTKQQKIFER